jgi:hypothetical protein
MADADAVVGVVLFGGAVGVAVVFHFLIYSIGCEQSQSIFLR